LAQARPLHRSSPMCTTIISTCLGAAPPANFEIAPYRTRRYRSAGPDAPPYADALWLSGAFSPHIPTRSATPTATGCAGTYVRCSPVFAGQIQKFGLPNDGSSPRLRSALLPPHISPTDWAVGNNGARQSNATAPRTTEARAHTTPNYLHVCIAQAESVSIARLCA